MGSNSVCIQRRPSGGPRAPWKHDTSHLVWDCFGRGMVSHLAQPGRTEYIRVCIITYFLTLNFFSTIKQCTFKVSCFVPMQTLSLNNSIT